MIANPVMSGGGGGLPGAKFQVTCAENSTELPLTGYSGSAEDIELIRVELQAAPIANVGPLIFGYILYDPPRRNVEYTDRGTSTINPSAIFHPDSLKFTGVDYVFKGTYDVTVYTRT